MKEITISIPEGTDKFTVKIEGGEAKVIYDQSEEKEWQPQDGEIVFSVTNTGLQHFIFPYCHMESAIFHDIKGKFELELDGCRYLYTSLRQATEDEKKMFHDALKEKGLRWNAEEKRVEKLPRWRAEKDECYYSISYDLSVSKCTDYSEDDDERSHEYGNYFKTREAAERVAKQIREIFKNSKAE